MKTEIKSYHFKKELQPMVDALQRRVNRGNNTTHKDWFIDKREQLGLDFERAHQCLRQSKVISKMRSKVSWPVCILLVKTKRSDV